MSPKIELLQRRFVESEIKIDAEKKKLGGYAVVYNVVIKFGNWMEEKIAPGACKKTIKEGDIRCLFNHDSNLILGRSIKGEMKTLRLKEDSKGLEYEVDLPNASYADDLRESVDRGDITGCSFQFRTIKDKWEYPQKANDPAKVTVLELRLYDVGPVTFPQYEETSVGLRSEDLDLDRFQFLLIKNSRGIILDDAEKLFIRSIFDRFSLDISERTEPGDHSENTQEPELISTLARMRQKGVEIKPFLQESLS